MARSKELEGRHWLCSFSVMHGDCARRLSVGYGAPPPRLEASGRLNPGDGIHLGCRSTGPLITFIELELREWVRLWVCAKAEVLDTATADASITKARNLNFIIVSSSHT